MSDARREEQEPAAAEQQPTGPAAEPQESPDPDALGAWPEGEREAAAMPDQRTAQAGEDGPSDAPPGEGSAAGGEDAGEDPARAAEAAAADPRSREELVTALQEVERERDEYLENLRRSHAEFENFRKRTMREGATQRESGKAELAGALLEVLDDLDRTLAATDESADEGLARGVQLVAEKLVGVLRDAGLERVDEPGVAFDPNRHEAVQQTPADEPRDEPVVAQVLRPGYLLGDRVLRAAMVVVEQ